MDDTPQILMPILEHQSIAPVSSSSVFAFSGEEMVLQWNGFFPLLISPYQKMHYYFLEITLFPVFQETTLQFFDFQLPILLLLEVLSIDCLWQNRLWSLTWSCKILKWHYLGTATDNSWSYFCFQVLLEKPILDFHLLFAVLQYLKIVNRVLYKTEK